MKGAIRRVFARSELRRKVLEKASSYNWHDPARPRVKKWSVCATCKKSAPRYLMQVDHIEPLVPLDKTLEDMSWDEVVNRTWCEESNLRPICKECHTEKTKAERKQRQAHKKEKKQNER